MSLVGSSTRRKGQWRRLPQEPEGAPLFAAFCPAPSLRDALKR